MLDKRCEIAWRMGRWQDAADVPLSDSRGGPAIHAAICKSLKVPYLAPFPTRLTLL